MAITLADFTKIWASTSPLTPYSFGDANYQEGWNFIGSTPPARQMWDSYMKRSDEKQQYIVNNFLPLSGGTMTGAIVGNPITLTADDGNGNISSFVGKADGTASWNGFDITPQKSSNQGTTTDVNVPNNSTTNLMSVNLTKGTWLIQAIAGFNGNSNGYRRLGISTNTSQTNADRYKVVDAPSTGSTTTHLSLTTIIAVESTTTYYINVYQNSGSTLATSGGYIIFKLSDDE